MKTDAEHCINYIIDIKVAFVEYLEWYAAFFRLLKIHNRLCDLRHFVANYDFDIRACTIKKACDNKAVAGIFAVSAKHGKAFADDIVFFNDFVKTSSACAQH